MITKKWLLRLSAVAVLSLPAIWVISTVIWYRLVMVERGSELDTKKFEFIGTVPRTVLHSGDSFLWIKKDIPWWLLTSGPYMVLTDSQHRVFNLTTDLGNDPDFCSRWPEVLVLYSSYKVAKYETYDNSNQPQ